MKTIVIIPAYNEAKNILNTVEDLRRNAPTVDLLVINDCSLDNTKNFCEREEISYVDLPVNLGIGGSVQVGYQYAVEQGYDIAIQFDGDGQHKAEYIGDLIAPIESGQADITIGSRFIRKEGFQSSSMRRLGIGFLSGLIDILCGIKVRDVTSGMRAVNRKMMEFFADNYAQDYPEPEAILASAIRDARIMEIPVQMRERQGGVSSINPIRSVYYMIKVSLALLLSRFSYGGHAT